MLLRDLRIYSFGFPIEERVLISNWLPISQYVTSRLSKNKEHWYNQEILHATTAPKWKGFGFHTDRKSFHCYVALNLNFNICIKKKKMDKKARREGPSTRKRSVHANRELSVHCNFCWLYNVLQGSQTCPAVSVPRPHVNNCVQNTLLGWAESAVPPNTTLTEPA